MHNNRIDLHKNKMKKRKRNINLKIFKQQGVVSKLIMAKDTRINLKFLKINYLSNIYYYEKDKTPKQVFTTKLINFFKENFETGTIFTYNGMGYRFGAVEIDNNSIFGKLWELKEKHEKDYPWTGKDYEIKPQLGADYHFSYFYIDTEHKHLVIQDERELTAEKTIQIIGSWFDSFHEVKGGMDIQYLKIKKEFFEELKDAYKIISAKFVLYPSNFDFDRMSKPLDDELHKLGISEVKEEIKSNEGIKMDLENPNRFSSMLAQSLRGNGKDPEIKTQNKNGSVSIITKKIKHIQRQILGIKDITDIRTIRPKIINELKDVMKEMDDGIKNNN